MDSESVMGRNYGCRFSGVGLLYCGWITDDSAAREGTLNNE